ncbi:MAG: nicotinate phosphoribosyltransferase, partial [Candidatus Binatia bacterium]
SGDLAEQARAVRRIFDQANLSDVKIIGSGGLDEDNLAQFTAANVPFDSYGVGTKMGMSADAPWTDMSYKLVQFQDRPVLKLSTGKASWPGRKQVFRFRDGTGQFVRDILGQRDENLAAQVLLHEYMHRGKLCRDYPSLIESRKVFAEDFAALSDSIKAARNPARYPVEYSPNLQTLRAEVERQVSNHR